MIGDKNKKKYLDDCGNHCPYCGHDEVSGGNFGSDSMEAWREVTCDTCGKTWNDVYKLSDVEEIE